MGLSITTKEENGEVLYQLMSTVTDTLIHEKEWLSLEEAKKALINKKLWRFIDDIQETDMCFPNGYIINGKMLSRHDGPDFTEYLRKQYSLDDKGEQQFKDFLSILAKNEIALYDTKKLEAIIADIRNKLSPLVNLAKMVQDSVNNEHLSDEKYLGILSTCADTGILSSKQIIAQLVELEKML